MASQALETAPRSCAAGSFLPCLLFSARFAESYLPMVALLPGVVLLGSGKVLASDLPGRGFPQYNAITSGLALGITVIADLLLIPRMGVLGASLASTLAYSVTLLVN